MTADCDLLVGVGGKSTYLRWARCGLLIGVGSKSTYLRWTRYDDR